MGHARAVLSLPTERSRIRFTKRIMRNNLSVRQAEDLIRQRMAKPGQKKKEKDIQLAQIEEQLQHHLGTRVNIIHGKKHGKIEIFYYSNEDLDRLLDLINKS